MTSLQKESSNTNKRALQINHIYGQPATLGQKADNYSSVKGFQQTEQNQKHTIAEPSQIEIADTKAHNSVLQSLHIAKLPLTAID